MIRLDLTETAAARTDLAEVPIAVLGLGMPVARADRTPRPLAILRLPEFPGTIEEAVGLMGVDGFLMGADGSILQGAG